MGGNWENLSKEQKEIYDLYFNQNLSVSDIAKRRQTTRQAVYKTLRKIKVKYDSDYKTNRGLHFEGYGNKCKPPTTKLQLWRFHGLHLIIKPYYFYPRYYKVMEERGNYGIQHKQFTIMLYKDSVRVQSKDGQGWRDKDKYKAIQAAETDFNDFLKFAAKVYGFEYAKAGRISIKLVSSELALEGSELAQGYEKTTGKGKLSITDKNGKVWFIIDKSQGATEHEYIGRDTFSNSEIIEPYINDFLYNNPLTNSQLASRLSDLITAVELIKEVIEKKI